jgi:putative oxygen-independent coproporphyrinogen III oxidase
MTASAGLYLHVPFCSRVCPYCDFAVTTGGPARRRAFVDHLLAEVDLWAGEAEGFGPFDTVYLGGGTPSALAIEDLARLLAALRERLAVTPDARLFFEANPEDVTPASLQAWRGLGFATLSLGVQSLDAAELAFLGRRHGPEAARQSVRLAREAGFGTVSLDLIFGLPGQTPETWRRTLEAAVELAPDHISCYQLTFHEGTPFGRDLERGRLAEMPEPAQAEIFALTHALLADAGYPAYEVSNFARAPEHRSRHNRKYWDHTPYLGLGPSAHSFDGRERWWNERRLGDWSARLAQGERPIAGREQLTPEQRALEALMLGLRTADGLDLGRLRQRYGVDLLGGERTGADNRAFAAQLAAERLLELVGGEEGTLRPTRAGLAVADALARGFEIEIGFL